MEAIFIIAAKRNVIVSCIVATNVRCRAQKTACRVKKSVRINVHIVDVKRSVLSRVPTVKKIAL